MHIDSTAAASALIQEGAQQIAALRDDAVDESHIAEHIRGMVAATMGHLPADASDTTRNNAAHWQQWALDVADGVAVPVAG